MKKKNLIWIDLEMTGLNPDTDTIIEIATIVTDKDLEIVAKGPNIVCSASNLTISQMDDWNTNQHSKSGLIDKVKRSNITMEMAEQETIDFLSMYVDAGESPMCGNSVHQDRRFMFKYMPNLEKFFHYRNIDVSTLKEIDRLWDEDDGKYIYEKPESKHLALSDIEDSIDEMKFYKDRYWK